MFFITLYLIHTLSLQINTDFDYDSHSRRIKQQFGVKLLKAQSNGKSVSQAALFHYRQPGIIGTSTTDTETKRDKRLSVTVHNESLTMNTWV